MTRVSVSGGTATNRILRNLWTLARISLQIPLSAGEKWECFTLEAQPRSLYMMSGESRHVWEHSIPPVETARYSITLRTMAANGRPDSGPDATRRKDCQMSALETAKKIAEKMTAWSRPSNTDLIYH
jgi:hypothetical protein